MEPRTILYQYRDDEISVVVEAYFSEDSLVVEGYDIGKKVTEFWGDSDYEYSTTVDKQHLLKLFQLLGVVSETEMLQSLAARFSGNHAYSAFQTFLTDHKIPFTSFSWT